MSPCVLTNNWNGQGCCRHHVGHDQLENAQRQEDRYSCRVNQVTSCQVKTWRPIMNLMCLKVHVHVNIPHKVSSWHRQWFKVSSVCTVGCGVNNYIREIISSSETNSLQYPKYNSNNQLLEGVKLHHCLHYGSASPKPEQKRRATLIVFDTTQCRYAATNLIVWGGGQQWAF